ncbi:MAG: chemotaxis protein CheC [Bacillota bacterium]|jgi:chemotaxis protein CheC|nr:chemotaxis protein CheC [Bacillota bacterium]NLJ01883.1 CheY-P-specific phosphatase CheC [Bacillota bacterium]
MSSDIKLDFLKELANIGTGHATTALSQMLGGRLFQLVVPDAQMLPFSEAAEYIGGQEQIVAGIFIVVSGDVGGYMAFLIPYDSAMVLVRLLTGDDSRELNELARSALQELGNIMITSYLNALSKMTGFLLAPSVPGVAVDMAGAVWESILAGAQVANEVTVIRTEFFADGESIEGNIIFLPDDDDFQKIARVLGLEEM